MSALELRGGTGGDTALGRRHSPRTEQPLYRPPGRRRATETSEMPHNAAAVDRRPPRQLYVPPRGRRHGLNRASSPGFSTCSEIVTSWRTSPDTGPARPPPGPRRRISQQTRQHVERLAEESAGQEAAQNGHSPAEGCQNGQIGSPQARSPGESPGKRSGRRRRRGGRRSRSSSEDRTATAASSAAAAVGSSPSFQVLTFPLSPTATAPRPAHVPWRSNAASGRFTPTPEWEAARQPPSRPRFQQPYQPPAMRDRPASAAAELPPSPQRPRAGPDSPQRVGQRGHGSPQQPRAGPDSPQRVGQRGHGSPQQRGYAPCDSPRRGSGQGCGAQNWRDRGDYHSPQNGGREASFSRNGERDSGRGCEQRGQISARPELRLNLRDSGSAGEPPRGQQRSPADYSPAGAVTQRRRSSGGLRSPRSPPDQSPTTPPSPRTPGDTAGSDSPRAAPNGTRREPVQQRPASGSAAVIAPIAPAAAPVAAPATVPAAPAAPAAGTASGDARPERAATGEAGVEPALPAGRYDHLVNTTDDEKVSLSARIGRAGAEQKATSAVVSPGSTVAENSAAQDGMVTKRRERDSAKTEDSVSPVSKERGDVGERSELASGGRDSSSGVVTDTKDSALAGRDDSRLITVQTGCTDVTGVTEISAFSPTSSHTETRPEVGSESETPPGQGSAGSESASAAVSPLRSDSVEAEAEAPAASRRRSSASSSRSLSATYERFDWAEEMEEWEKNYTDDGEPTDKVAPPALSRPVIDYLAWRPPSPPSPAAEDDADLSEAGLPSHVLEVYDFPSSFTTQDLTMVFQEFGARGFDIRWVDDTHALAVFSSAACVAEALLKQHPLVRCRPLSQASPRARQKAARCQQAQALEPHRPRPETCALQARRMVFTALGRRDSAPREQREQERRQLQTARDKKRLAAKQKQDAWEGNF